MAFAVWFYTRTGTQVETQCYGYDGLDRLDAAWTSSAAAGTASGAATSNPCASAPTAVTASAASSVTDGIPGSAYWTTWSFDALGDRTSQVRHGLAAGSPDTTTQYAYGQGTGGTSQPSTLALATTTGGAVILRGSLEARAGWTSQLHTPSESQLNSFLTGWSITKSGYLPIPGRAYGPSVAETWGNPGSFGASDTATEVGLAAGGDPGTSTSVSYGWDVTSWLGSAGSSLLGAIGL